MYIIPWEKCSWQSGNSTIADIGDIRLVLSPHGPGWTVSIGIRVYTADKTQSMVRPQSNVLRITTPCELAEAMDITQEYFNNFLSSVLNTLK